MFNKIHCVVFYFSVREINDDAITVLANSFTEFLVCYMKMKNNQEKMIFIT